MFGVSLPELLVILLITLLVFGPEKLPELARSLGRFSALLKKNSDAVRREFYNTVYSPVKDVSHRLNSSVNELITLKPERAPEKAEDAEKQAGTKDEAANNKTE